MKRRFGKDGLTGQKQFRNSLGHAYCPVMVAIFAISEGHNKAGIRNALHRREKPFRDDKSAGPVKAPAWRRNRWLPPSDLASSSRCRIRRPTGIPVRRDVSFSQASSSSVRRIVIV